MIIKNFSEIATTLARRDALEITNAGMEAVLTKNAMEKFVKLKDNILTIKHQEFNISKYENIYVIGGGKAAADMAESIEAVLGNRITKGLVTDVTERKLQYIEVDKGTHPLPSNTNLEACSRMVDIAEAAGENDLIITLISGGGSAILAHPRCPLDKLIEMNDALLKGGVDIHHMNAVRKHLSKIKGGQLSQIAFPAEIVSVIISDVLGNDLSVIASGPTVHDPSTLEGAKDVIKEYDLPDFSKWFEETPKDDKWFTKTHNILVLDNSVAVKAMERKAKELGYETEILGYEVEGEARELGYSLARKIKPDKVFIGAGETTVTVEGDGKGGRNQEVALGAVGNFGHEGVVISAGTDGIDNTPAAGAVADEKSYSRAKELDLDPMEYLSENNAYRFFEKTRDLIITGPTGTNVADVMLALGAKRS